jgi:hypothetical protein
VTTFLKDLVLAYVWSLPVCLIPYIIAYMGYQEGVYTLTKTIGLCFYALIAPIGLVFLWRFSDRNAPHTHLDQR